MPKTRRALTPQQREQWRAEQRELVRASIEQLRASEGWQAYLHARRRFSSHSWRNVLLILSQHPTATRVAGFSAWLELGYCVMKGSTGIRIWARCDPSRKRMQAWRDAGADPDQRPRATYKLVSVFAQDQVAPLPPPAKPVSLTAPIAETTGDSHQHLLAAITELAGELGYTVSVCDTGPADGTCNRQTHEIKIAERLSPNGRLAAGSTRSPTRSSAPTRRRRSSRTPRRSSSSSRSRFAAVRPSAWIPAPTAARTWPAGLRRRASRCSSRPWSSPPDCLTGSRPC
jgi:N-terminal domain of anti-restriction factor ArdC